RWWRGWSERRAGGCAGPRASSGGAAILGALVALHAAAGCHRSVTTHVARTAGPLIDRLADGIFQTPQNLAKDYTLIAGQRRQRRIGKHLDGFAGIQADDRGKHPEVPDIHQAFIEG